MKKTKYQRNCLIIAVVCFVISIISVVGLYQIVIESYSYDIEVIDGVPMKLFPPRAPSDSEWEYEDRFRYKSWKKTINC